MGGVYPFVGFKFLSLSFSGFFWCDRLMTAELDKLMAKRQLRQYVPGDVSELVTEHKMVFVCTFLPILGDR